ncbi:MAG: hypothetical protein JWM82_815 [Myxococcales bacterium]|nr:hypothetical protein [Myxococcales bacterium]
MRRAAAVTFACLSLAGAAHAAGPALPPTPDRWVTDGVGFLSPSRRAELDAKLEAYQQKTGHQVIVWVGGTIGGAPLDDWAVKTFQSWKVGRKGIDDGVVIFVLASDRKIDIEVGYGLEDKVPDVIASRIIREVMSPRLRHDDRDGAVQSGVDAVLAAIEGRPVGDLAREPSGEPTVAPRLSRPQMILYGVLIFAFLVLLALNPRVAMLFLWSILGGGRGGGGGGGGFSGGGGRSGGGGARGSW